MFCFEKLADSLRRICMTLTVDTCYYVYASLTEFFMKKSFSNMLRHALIATKLPDSPT